MPFDCELLRDGWPAQPINTLSAVAFVAVGLWLWRGGRRLPAVLSAAVGLGSMWFHGAPGDAPSGGNDITLYALVVLGVIEVGRQVARRRRPVVAAGILTAGLVVWFLSRTGGALCDPDSVIQGHSIWHVAAALAVGVLFGTHRSGSQQTTTAGVGLSQK